jgi:hypothetical protein
VSENWEATLRESSPVTLPVPASSPEAPDVNVSSIEARVAAIEALGTADADAISAGSRLSPAQFAPDLVRPSQLTVCHIATGGRRLVFSARGPEERMLELQTRVIGHAAGAIGRSLQVYYYRQFQSVHVHFLPRLTSFIR